MPIVDCSTILPTRLERCLLLLFDDSCAKAPDLLLFRRCFIHHPSKMLIFVRLSKIGGARITLDRNAVGSEGS